MHVPYSPCVYVQVNVRFSGIHPLLTLYGEDLYAVFATTHASRESTPPTKPPFTPLHTASTLLQRPPRCSRTSITTIPVSERGRDVAWRSVGVCECLFHLAFIGHHFCLPFCGPVSRYYNLCFTPSVRDTSGHLLLQLSAADAPGLAVVHTLHRVFLYVFPR